MAEAGLGKLADEVRKKWEGVKPELREVVINVHLLLEGSPRKRLEPVPFPSHEGVDPMLPFMTDLRTLW